MPMFWRRIAWFVSFAVAVCLALWMLTAGYGWPATLGAAVTWLVLSFVISQLCAAYVLRRMHGRMYRNPPDDLADKIAVATKGLPPEEREAVAKRIIDEAFKP
jgi:membrane protein implicated in regulation of membrane protease activity